MTNPLYIWFTEKAKSLNILKLLDGVTALPDAALLCISSSSSLYLFSSDTFFTTFTCSAAVGMYLSSSEFGLSFLVSAEFNRSSWVIVK